MWKHISGLVTLQKCVFVAFIGTKDMLQFPNADVDMCRQLPDYFCSMHGSVVIWVIGIGNLMYDQELKTKYNHKTHDAGVRSYMCNYRHGGVFHAHKKRTLPPSGRFSGPRAVYPAPHLHIRAAVCVVCIVYAKSLIWFFNRVSFGCYKNKVSVHIATNKTIASL